MKKILKYSALAVITACALVSCAKDELKPAETEKSLHFVINTAEETPLKSFVDNNLNGTYTPKWSKGDELAMFVGDITSSTSAPTATLSNTAETGVTATFDGTVPTDLTDGSFLSFSPAGAFEKGYTDGTVGINLSEIQNPSSHTIDEACDVLVAKQCDFTADKGVVAINDLYFKRIFSIVKVNLNLNGAEALKNEKVTSFTLKAPATLTGRAAVDLSAASISKWNVANQSVTAKYTTDTPVFGGENGRENTVWFVVNPTTVASGSTITFSGETENYTFTKEVTLTKDVVFPQGQLAVINLTIADGNYAAKTAETRIWAEVFDNVTTNKSTPDPSVTGAAGTGVTENLAYAYTSADVRCSNNGHSSSDYYLWNGTAAAEFTVNNIAISGETTLLFSCQGRTSQGTTVVTVSYKESSADVWTTAGTFTAGTTTFDTVQKIVFAVNSSVSSLDIQITNDGGNLLLDDFALESFVDTRTTLTVPANVSASVDAETANKVNVSWDAVENASGYEVVLSSEGKEDIVKTTSTSPLAVSGLDYATTYSVKVKATTTDVENYIESEYSAAVSVTTGEKGSTVEDKLVSNLFPATTTTYVDFSSVKVLSNAVYAGNSAYSNSGISLRSKNNSGIVTTTSGGKVKGIVVEWISNTISGRTIDVYGKNTAYSSAADLYTSSTQGTKIGSIVFGTSTELTISDDYQYIGLRSNDGALYVSSITITWDASGSSEGGSDPVTLTAPVVSCTAQTENSLTFEWDAVANATGYQVSVDGGINYGTTQSETTYIWSGLDPETTKTLYVKAIGDGSSYTDSDAVSAEGTTTASSGGENPGVTTISLDDSEIIGLGQIAYTDKKEIIDGTITWTVYAHKDAQTRPWLQLKKDLGVYVKISAPSAIKEVRLTITSATNSKGGVADILKHTAYSSTGTISLKSADAVGDTTTNDVASCSGSDISNNSVTLIPTGDYKELYLKVSAAARIWGVEVDY